ncbi:MAG: BtrH N-terminal domain-containing protein [Myxococcales bacterium]|nr:BtrH N-terminal domain-containing protein [Myxococcales bacterium]
MHTLIDGYQSFPGDHCGSVAMRGLLHHYCGLSLPEGAVFGLGSGIDCGYWELPDGDPPVLVFGRTGTMEADAAAALQVDYREQAEPDDAEAWRVVREEAGAGRPTMLSGDIFYLDYREFKVHFPAHRFVLLGFDDEAEQVFIADRIREEFEVCSYGALAKSRNPPVGISTFNLWGRFHGTEVGRNLTDATRFAIARCAERMLAPGGGVDTIRRVANDVPGWPERGEPTWIASYNARCIEKFGNGGGNFRRLYASFLGWARELDPALVPESAEALAVRAADGWTAMSGALAKVSEEGAPPDGWTEAAEHAVRVADTEQELFERLAERAA